LIAKYSGDFVPGEELDVQTLEIEGGAYTSRERRQVDRI
jgi:hypothetical protein